MICWQKIETASPDLLNIDLKLPPLSNNLIDLAYENEIESHSTKENGIDESSLPFRSSELFYANIQSYRLLTRGENVKPAYEVTFCINNANLKYQSGDTVGIIPKNDPDEVATLIKLLKIEDKALQRYRITAKANLLTSDAKKFKVLSSFLPLSGTLQHALTNQLNIRTVIKKTFLRSLSLHCCDFKEKRYLEFLSSREGSGLYNTLILNRNVSILDILKSLTSCTPPMEIILQNLTKLLPRPFSICSSTLNDNELKICFSVAQFDNGLKGVATGFLESLLPTLENNLKNLRVNSSITNRRVPLYLRTSTSFRLPQNDDSPIVMIATGAGISPFIGFLREIVSNPGPKIREVYLFYGCRYEHSDFLYKEELNGYVDDRTLTKLNVCFSRDATSKKYVQDDLKHESRLIIDLICKEATVYVCGNSNAQKCITSTLKGLIDLDQLITKQKYLIDSWQ